MNHNGSQKIMKVLSKLSKEELIILEEHIELESSKKAKNKVKVQLIDAEAILPFIALIAYALIFSLIIWVQ